MDRKNMKNPLPFEVWLRQEPVDIGIRMLVTDSMMKQEAMINTACKLMADSMARYFKNNGQEPKELNYDYGREEALRAWGCIATTKVFNGETYQQYSDYVYSVARDNYAEYMGFWRFIFAPFYWLRNKFQQIRNKYEYDKE